MGVNDCEKSIETLTCTTVSSPRVRAPACLFVDGIFIMHHYRTADVRRMPLDAFPRSTILIIKNADRSVCRCSRMDETWICPVRLRTSNLICRGRETVYRAVAPIRLDRKLARTIYRPWKRERVTKPFLAQKRTQIFGTIVPHVESRRPSFLKFSEGKSALFRP